MAPNELERHLRRTMGDSNFVRTYKTKFRDFHVKHGVYPRHEILLHAIYANEEMLRGKIVDPHPLAFGGEVVVKNPESASNRILKEKSGGCFITTAVCGSLGKSDDCYELTLLRNFRDIWLSKQDTGGELIKEYYAVAPAIVEAIDKLKDKNDIYAMIYEKYIQPCISFIKSGKETECMNLYRDMVNTLKQVYS